MPLHRRAKTEHEALPIWMAALIAAGCLAKVGGDVCEIDWKCSSGRAFYTNSSGSTVQVLPFDLHVESGHTVIVSWLPGETAYTVELYRPDFLAA